MSKIKNLTASITSKIPGINNNNNVARNDSGPFKDDGHSRMIHTQLYQFLDLLNIAKRLKNLFEETARLHLALGERVCLLVGDDSCSSVALAARRVSECIVSSASALINCEKRCDRQLKELEEMGTKVTEGSAAHMAGVNKEVIRPEVQDQSKMGDTNRIMHMVEFTRQNNLEALNVLIAMLRSCDQMLLNASKASERFLAPALLDLDRRTRSPLGKSETPGWAPISAPCAVKLTSVVTAEGPAAPTVEPAANPTSDQLASKLKLAFLIRQRKTPQQQQQEQKETVKLKFPGDSEEDTEVVKKAEVNEKIIFPGDESPKKHAAAPPFLTLKSVALSSPRKNEDFLKDANPPPMACHLQRNSSNGDTNTSYGEEWSTEDDDDVRRRGEDGIFWTTIFNSQWAQK